AQAEALALADREPGHASVLAQRPTCAINDRARTEDRGIAIPQKLTVIPIGNETDLLALGLVRGHQSEPTRVLPDLILGQVADRKARGRQLRLRERPQEVGLVLAQIAGAPQDQATIAWITRDARVVAGRHCSGVPCVGAREERAEL